MRNKIAILRKFSANESGASAIEFGIMLPFMVLCLVVMADLSTALLLKMELTSAARAGAQHGLVTKATSSDLSAVETAAMNAIADGGGIFDFRNNASSVASINCQCSGGSAVSCSDSCSSPEYLQRRLTVTVTNTWTPLITYPGVDPSLNLSGAAIVRLR